ncbi:MAG: hypothetical protein IJN18_04010 [Clostridia bacterium]|nr:hypothetical protein [Clostridia bacterium]
MLWGIFLVFCILGTVQHFLFQPLGRPRALLWLLPVSESPWEHYKLSFWPLGGALGTVALLTGLPFSAFVCAWFAGAGHAFCTMLGIYCFYRWGLGVKRPVLWADIGSYYITMFLGWRLGLRVLLQPPRPGAAIFAGVALLACALLFPSAAALPPQKYPLFREETKNGRNQRTTAS